MARKWPNLAREVKRLAALVCVLVCNMSTLSQVLPFRNYGVDDGAGILDEIQDHQGNLSFESEPGKGTRFPLKLPVDNGWELGEAAKA